MYRYVIYTALCALFYTPFALALDLSTDKQKYSYTIGMQIGQMLRGQNVGEIDIDAFAAAVDDYLGNSQPRLTKAQMTEAMKNHFSQLQAQREQQKKENLAKGEAFRKQFGESENVKTLESGLQYEILSAGNGEPPKQNDDVTVHYHGTHVDGRVFDSTRKQGSQGRPTKFNLANVIPGFREAITRMKPGAKWKVVMPPDLAYGEKGAGRSIGPSETLVFEIELVGVEEKKAPNK